MIESLEGVGNTTAYRGMAYIVMEDFPLADYSNRIPNFTFEIKRKVLDSDDGDVLENMISAMVMIPGSGEFVYDTVTQTKVPGYDVSGNWVQSGSQTYINQNNGSGKTDALASLDQLLDTCPNLQWISLVVTWFGTNTDAGSCLIQPGVEYQTGAILQPDTWSVDTYTRWLECTQYQLGLPLQFAMLEPTDVITVNTDTSTHTIRIVSANYGKAGMLNIKGVAEEIATYDVYATPGSTQTQTQTQTQALPAISATHLEFWIFLHCRTMIRLLRHYVLRHVGRWRAGAAQLYIARMMVAVIIMCWVISAPV